MCSLQEVSGLQKTIELQDSEITIGRGPFLGVTDKRVSRNHGILSRVENGIELKSIHVNPCFYTKNSDDKWLKLDKNESIILHPGDTFSLLPKQYIYKVIAKETIEAQKSDSESHEIVSKNEETDQMESKAKVPSTVDPAPLLLAKISHSKEGETSKHLSQAETKHASKFNDHDSAKFKIRDAEKAADIDLSPDSDSAKIQKQAVSTELLSDNDSAKFEAHKSDEVATAQEKAENPDKECVKIHPNHSKTPKKEHPKAFAKISSTKTPTYVKRKYTNTYMDGDKEVALPSETKRKLPSWMKAKKSDATNLSRKKNDEPPKKVVKTKKITPKRPVAKKRQKVQKIDFDSDETPDELEAEPQYGSEDDKEIEADVEDHDRVTVPRGRRQEDDVTKEVEKDGDRFIIDLSPNNQNGNDVTSEDVAMVDVSIAAKSVEVDDDVAPRSDSNGLPSNPGKSACL